MRFSEIVGHRQALEKLRSMADSGRVPHALMLHGPSGVGKMQAAMAFAQYLFCTDRQGGDSCGRCPACLQTAKLNNPDIRFVFPIVKKGNLDLSSDFADEWKGFLRQNPYVSPEQWLETIEAGNSRPMIYKSESEEILRLSTLSAYGSGYKIFIVWQPEKMNAEAANKLLKVVEEPFEDTLFIFVSNNPGDLLPTILSRVQGVEFKFLPDSDVTDFLVKAGKCYEEAAALARIAKGNMNRALMLADETGENVAFMEAFIGIMRAAYGRKMPDLKQAADTFAGFGREKALRFLEYIARMVRESFISNLCCAPLESMLPAEKKFVERFGPFIHAANVEELSRQVDRAREDISRNANQKIVWFDFLIELTRLIRTNNNIK